MVPASRVSVPVVDDSLPVILIGECHRRMFPDLNSICHWAHLRWMAKDDADICPTL